MAVNSNLYEMGACRKYEQSVVEEPRANSREVETGKTTHRRNEVNRISILMEHCFFRLTMCPLWHINCMLTAEQHTTELVQVL